MNSFPEKYLKVLNNVNEHEQKKTIWGTEHESRKLLPSNIGNSSYYFMWIYFDSVTVGLCVILQHFYPHDGTKLCQGLQMVDMDDEWSENIIQVVTQSLKHFTAMINV